jgi:hypothetical protein
VRLVFVASAPFQIVANGRVQITANRETLLPVVFAVFESALLEMLGDFQKHSFTGTAIYSHGEAAQRSNKVIRVAIFFETAQAVKHIVAVQQHIYRFEGHKIATAFALLDIADGSAGKFSAFAGVFNCHGAYLS